MAYMVDRESGKYWRYYGKGLTSDPTMAFDFPESVASALLRLFWESTYMMKLGADGKFQNISYKPEKNLAPLVTSEMKKHDLLWVAHDGVWFATNKQALIMGTLKAFNMPGVAA